MEVTESISVYTGVDTIHETVFDIAGDVRGRVCGTQTLYRSGLRVFSFPFFFPLPPLEAYLMRVTP